jgi:hypothetical protein
MFGFPVPGRCPGLSCRGPFGAEYPDPRILTRVSECEGSLKDRALDDCTLLKGPDFESRRPISHENGRGRNDTATLSVAPKGQPQISPGQRPGDRSNFGPRALKGPNIASPCPAL